MSAWNFINVNFINVYQRRKWKTHNSQLLNYLSCVCLPLPNGKNIYTGLDERIHLMSSTVRVWLKSIAQYALPCMDSPGFITPVKGNGMDSIQNWTSGTEVPWNL